MQLKRLERREIPSLKRFYSVQNTRISNYSAGFAFMWGEDLSTHYDITQDCLVLCDSYDGDKYFYWPLSADNDIDKELKALDEIEQYCRTNYIRLRFTSVPSDRLHLLVQRYGADMYISNSRRWRDYLYNAQDFVNYPGKKYSGQRNHVNKFLRQYPRYSFETFHEDDLQDVLRFLGDVATVQAKKGTIALTEIRGVSEILPHLDSLGLFGAVLRVDGEVVGFSVGEVCGDTMIVHVEKALRSVDGAYPMLAQQFAKRYAANVQYINREDDAGDIGLRKSKMQYLPVAIVDKFTVEVRNAMHNIVRYPSIKTARLKIGKIKQEDVANFARLARDGSLNKYWGYDWTTKAGCDNPPDSWFLNDVYQDFKNKHELPLAIYYDNTLAGEVVLHNFGYRSEAEIGMRVLPEYQHKGIAREALIATMQYAFARLNIEKVEAKCFKENTTSAYTLKSAGMKECGEDEIYLHFYKTAEM